MTRAHGLLYLDFSSTKEKEKQINLFSKYLSIIFGIEKQLICHKIIL